MCVEMGTPSNGLSEIPPFFVAWKNEKNLGKREEVKKGLFCKWWHEQELFLDALGIFTTLTFWLGWSR